MGTKRRKLREESLSRCRSKFRTHLQAIFESRIGISARLRVGAEEALTLLRVKSWMELASRRGEELTERRLTGRCHADLELFLTCALLAGTIAVDAMKRLKCQRSESERAERFLRVRSFAQSHLTATLSRR